MVKFYFSVVIPSYNEEENFKRGLLEEIETYLLKQSFSWEAILVNDGSTDTTPKLLQEFAKDHTGFRIVDIKHGGKLKAIEAGIKEAKGEIILLTDFDQSTPISEFDKFLPKFESGAEIVIGSRVSPGAKRINDPFFRYLRSRILNFLIQILLFGGIDDTQCGFKAIRLEVAQKIFANLKVTHLVQPKGGFMGPWDIELLFLARKLKYKVVSVPITWRYSPSRRLSVFSESAKFIADIVTIKLFDLMGKYNA